MPYRSNYSIDAQVVVANGTKSNIVLVAASTCRPAIFYIDVGFSATPADNAILFNMQRFTVAGTTTAYTPVPLDSSAHVANCTAGVNATVEPTYTSAKILWRKAINQRASLSLVLDPDGALLCPATAANGIGMFPTHASFTGNSDCTIHFYE